MLINGGAHVDVVTKEGTTPAFVAARGGHEDCVAALAKAGANIAQAISIASRRSDSQHAYKLLSRYACAHCGVSSASAKLTCCSGCSIAYYCCRDHQKKAWKVHKLRCNAASAKKDSMSSLQVLALM